MGASERRTDSPSGRRRGRRCTMGRILVAVVAVLFAGPSPASALTFIPYKELVDSHLASVYYELSYLRSLRTKQNGFGEYHGESDVLTTDLSLIDHSGLMEFECETPKALNFSTFESRVDTNFHMDLYERTGFSIDGWFRTPISGRQRTIISSWGPKAQRWRVFLDPQGRLSFSYTDVATKGAPFKTCAAFDSNHLPDVWHYFVVRYKPTSQPNLQLWINGTLITRYRPPETSCGAISNITSRERMPITVGAAYPGGVLSDNWQGDLQKIAVYRVPLSDDEIQEHWERGLQSFDRPCTGKGECVKYIGTYYCKCKEEWYGATCTDKMQVEEVEPFVGSMFGGTDITIHGNNFDGETLIRESVSVRIGPNPYSKDRESLPRLEDQAYGGCDVVSYSPSEVVCRTNFDNQDWHNRGEQYVSVVLTERVDWNAQRTRPVFAQCASINQEGCTFHPRIEYTPRVWSHPRWGLPGGVLTFIGENFRFAGHTELRLGEESDNLQCNLVGEPTSTKFSCRLPEALPPAQQDGYWQLRLFMEPFGLSWPLKKKLFIHRNSITIYPLYPRVSRVGCHKRPIQVNIFADTYNGTLGPSDIRLYEAPCPERRVVDFDWLRDKVPDDYWKTFDQDSCPPSFARYSEPTYVPRAFTLQDTVRNENINLNDRRRARRFYDYQGRSFCLFMELDD